ncbi:40S small subunit processome assembly factor 1 isoform 2-T2 [Anomaloglossus baeobatrachus]|uniref:40S small subunit processome assembly factor 1 isoform X2 n=1 Tax=Anomaloglossus baeobatrachus TaxID=238106 RepID=UPI003F4FCE38
MTEGSHPSDVRDQLDSVLSNLYDFGEDFVTHEGNKPTNGQIPDLSQEVEAEKVIVHAENRQVVTCSKRGKKNVSMFFDSIKDELCSQAKNPSVATTSASKPSAVQVVTFSSRKDKKQSNNEDIHDTNPETNIDETEGNNILEFNFEKARLEVHKFGIRGYEKEKQRKCEQDRAIMLGAKPPKREYVNYKLYQETIKEKELAEKEKRLQENGFEPAKKKQKQGKNDRWSRRKRGLGKAPTGQVGKFKDGALILRNKDIRKIKRSKVIK